MRFRLRIYSPGGVQDFILPVGRFLVGRNPQTPGQFRITFPFVREEHLLFASDETTCTVQVVGDPAAPHETFHNDQPLILGQVITLHDGDRLVIRQPVPADAPALPEEDQLIAFVFETLADEPTAPPLLAAPSVVTVADSLAGGLQHQSVRLIHYLPEIYRPDQADTTFLSRFLALLESFLLPAEWTILGFDLLLDLRTAPVAFLPWLAQWVALDEVWDDRQQRALLAHYPWRGTRRGVQRLLEVYTGHKPQVIDGLERPLFSFQVHFPVSEAVLRQAGIPRSALERLLDVTKPAHTTYQLTFTE